jgi:hypothetical protein
LIEERGLVELGWLWKRLAEVDAVRCAMLQAAEAGKDTELSGCDAAVLRRKSLLL